MTSQNLRRRLRRLHRYFTVILLSLYVVSGITMLAIGESPHVQWRMHIMIGIFRGIA